MSKPFLEFVHPDDRERTREALSVLAEGQEVRGFRNRYRMKDGGFRWLEWVTRPVGDEVLAVARDVTENQRSAQELQRRLAQLELAEEVGRTGSWHVDFATGLYWSPEVYRIHGRAPSAGTPPVDEAIGYYHPDDRATVQRALERATERREPFEFELRILREDGETRFVHSIGRPEIGPDGEVVGVFGVFRDITDDDRRRRHEELELYAHALSHDLREPARTVGSFLPLLLDGLELDDEKQMFADFIVQAAARMHAQLDGLLRYTQAGIPRALGPVALGPLVEGIVADLQLHEAVELPALPTVRGDEVLLRQIFVGLFQNARKYASDDRVLRIVLRVETDGGASLIHVEDNGVGFDPVHAKLIFAPFKRLGQKHVPGTGMGLTIAARMAERCDGRITAEGRPGEGATFTVQLQTER